jgi:hypothetical protein
MKSMSKRATDSAVQTRIDFMNNEEQGRGYSEQGIRVAAVETRYDVALLCFWAREGVQTFRTIRALLVLGVILLMVLVWRLW